MNTFSSVLKDLIEENSTDIKTLADYLGLADISMVYKWLKGERSILLSTAVNIADFFNCSLDYLFGRSAYFENSDYNKCLPFDIQFRNVLEEQKISQYRLVKDKIISGGNINCWLNKKQTPHIESIIKLADYLNVSMDYVAGREK